MHVICLLCSSSSVGEFLNTRDPVQGKFNSFAATLVPLMIECWIESVPNQQTASGSGKFVMAWDHAREKFWRDIHFLMTHFAMWLCEWEVNFDFKFQEVST